MYFKGKLFSNNYKFCNKKLYNIKVSFKKCRNYVCDSQTGVMQLMDYDELFRMSFNQAREEVKEEMKDDISCALEKFFNNVLECTFTKENELLTKL